MAEEANFAFVDAARDEDAEIKPPLSLFRIKPTHNPIPGSFACRVSYTP